MKVALGSDLHLEHCKRDSDGKVIHDLPPIPDGVDLLLLAGDIGEGGLGIEVMDDHTDVPKAMVAGNHEFYGGPYGVRKQYLETRAEEHGVCLLDCGVLELNEETVLIGATMRSPLYLEGHPVYHPEIYEANIGDFLPHHTWTAQDHLAQFANDISFIEDMLLKYSDKKRIVMTHFVPSVEAIGLQYVGNHLNPYFNAGVDEVIHHYRPDMWLFGHTHVRFDKLHSNGKTRLVCNPKGYPRENPTFEWKVLDL